MDEEEITIIKEDSMAPGALGPGSLSGEGRARQTTVFEEDRNRAAGTL